MRRSKNKARFRRCKKTGLLSTDSAQSAPNDPFMHRMEKIMLACADRDFSIEDVCRASNVRSRQWRRWQSGRAMPRPSSVRKLERALRKMIRAQEAQQTDAALALVTYRMVLCAFAERAGLDPRQVLADDPHDQDKQSAFKHSASLCRQRALYLIVTELNVSLVAAAGMAGISKQAVSKSLRSIEESRDDHKVEQLLEEMAGLIHGGDDA